MSNQSIERAVKDFKDWRSQRKNRRAPTPNKLRKMALGLCAREGEESVRTKLGLSTSQIWEWKRSLAKLGSSDGVGRKPKRSAKRRSVGDEQRPKFVDVTPNSSPLNPGSISRIVEWSRSDGSKMKLCGVSMADIAGLAAEFLRGDVNQGKT